jgi:hypothetical protein
MTGKETIRPSALTPCEATGVQPGKEAPCARTTI